MQISVRFVMYVEVTPYNKAKLQYFKAFIDCRQNYKHWALFGLVSFLPEWSGRRNCLQTDSRVLRYSPMGRYSDILTFPIFSRSPTYLGSILGRKSDPKIFLFLKKRNITNLVFPEIFTQFFFYFQPSHLYIHWYKTFNRMMQHATYDLFIIIKASRYYSGQR